MWKESKKPGNARRRKFCQSPNRGLGSRPLHRIYTSPGIVPSQSLRLVRLLRPPAARRPPLLPVNLAITVAVNHVKVRQGRRSLRLRHPLAAGQKVRQRCEEKRAANAANDPADECGVAVAAVIVGMGGGRLAWTAARKLLVLPTRAAGVAFRDLRRAARVGDALSLSACVLRAGRSPERRLSC